MNTPMRATIAGLSLLATLAGPVRLTAHEPGKVPTHYTVIDLGTLGGPHSYGSVNGDGFRLLNNSGVVVSYADLALPDPNASSPLGCYDPDCFQAHAARWTEGAITDLGALPINNNSAGGSINERGWATGQSQSPVIDPVLGFPEFRAVLWKDNEIVDLGTLGGAESLGIYVNDAGQVIGFSTVSTVPDPVGFFGFPTHTFIWQNGEKLDIGTLGGDDAFPGASCSSPPVGQVAGGSTTTTALNSDTGLPTIEPFLWREGRMIDLGTLGGSIGFAQCSNHHRQVIGISSLAISAAACAPVVLFGAAGNPGCHAFFWQDGRMTDLGTLGGDVSEAIWLNDASDVVGSADLPGGQIHHAVFWRHGEIHDLGTVAGDPCSRGRGLNSRGQVVGGSSDCSHFLHAFIWEAGGPMVDLNTLIPPDSGFQLTVAYNINERGEILADTAPLGFTPIDAELRHQVLLIPCDGEEADCSAGVKGGRIVPAASSIRQGATVRSLGASAPSSQGPRETSRGWHASMGYRP